MKKNILFLIIPLSMLFASCATLINTTTQDIEIQSVPTAAKITIDSKKFGITPQKVNLERGSNHVIRLEMDGFEPYETQVTKKISYYTWLNAFNLWIPGLTIDYFNGAMYDLTPEKTEAIMLVEKKIEKPGKKP